MKYIFLSHPIATSTPLYRGKGKITVKRVNSLSGGGVCNSYYFAMMNHAGTHIDAPNHFFAKGRKISDVDPQTWIFRSPCLIDLKLAPDEIIKCGDWTARLSPAHDIIIFRTGWTAKRGKKEYIYNNPGLHPEIAFFIRKNHPNIRAVGIDFISISSYNDRRLGRLAHRAFLDPKGLNRPLFLIEDMNIPFALKKLKKLWVFPILINDIDSSPCTAVGKIA